MLQVFSDLIRGITQDAVGYARRIVQGQLKAAFLIEEAKQVAELREHASVLESQGHKDLADCLRQQVDVQVKGFTQAANEFSKRQEQTDFPDDPKAKVILAANLLAPSHQGLLTTQPEKPTGAKRGRPKKNRPDSPVA